MLQPRTTTPARAAAARANGAKSRGPVTEQGKSQIIRNALRHGFRAQTLSPTAEDQVAAERCETLFNNVLNEIDAADPGQFNAALVFAAATAELERIEALEDQAIREEANRLAAADPELTRTELEAVAFQNLCDRSGFLELCQRRGSRCDRLIFRAIARLHPTVSRRENKEMNEQTPEHIENKQMAGEITTEGTQRTQQKGHHSVDFHALSRNAARG